MIDQHNNLQRSLRGQALDECVPCHITELEAYFEREDDNNFDDYYVCHYTNTKGARASREIVLSKSFAVKHKLALVSGTAHFCIPESFTNSDGQLEIQNDHSLIQELPERNLQQQQTNVPSGTKSLIAVRITTTFGEAPVETLEEMQGAIFGLGSNSALIPNASVVSQYKDVSHGNLILAPAEGVGIVNGAIEVQLDYQIQGAEIQTQLASRIQAAVEATLGKSLNQIADRFIFCLPNSATLQGSNYWTAFTYLFEPYSYYQQSRCTKLSVVMHELGHSFGFRHSGANGNEYGDESGYLGYAENMFGMPRKAFNAHKHWLSGWFRQRAVSVDPALKGSAIGGRLVSFVDYGDSHLTSHDVVLVKAGNLYIQYNRAKGYNVDTPEPYIDRVVITEATGDLEISWWKAALVTGDEYVYQNFSGNNSLVIKVCDQLTGLYDFALISLHMDDGMQSSACNGTEVFDPRINSGYSNGSFAWNGSASFHPFIAENSKLAENPGTSSSIVVGVVWGLVGVLVSLACYILYRLRSAKRLRAQRQTKARKQNEATQQKSDMLVGTEVAWAEATAKADALSDSESDETQKLDGESQSCPFSVHSSSIPGIQPLESL
jgi:hypothetical protein